MKNEKPWYKKWWVQVLALFVIVSIPIVINWAYMKGTELSQPNTAFSASDLILFYGSFLSSIGTVSLGLVAYKQNEKANETSNRLLRIEEERRMPVIDFFDYEINFNIPYNALPIMSFRLSENPSQYNEIRLLVRNISEIPIDKIELCKISVFQTSQNNNSAEMKKFDKKVIDCSKIEGYMNQMSPFEYKELVFLLPTEIRISKCILNNFHTNTRFEMVLKLTTYSQRTYLQKIEFINFYTLLIQEKGFTSKITNKHISIQEEK